MRAVLNLADAAYYLHMTEAAIRELVRDRKIPYRKRGDTLMFLIDDLQTWMRALPGISAAEAVGQLQIPARFADASQTNGAELSPPETDQPAPIRLRKGRRQRHAVELPREQQR